MMGRFRIYDLVAFGGRIECLLISLMHSLQVLLMSDVY